MDNLTIHGYPRIFNSKGFLSRVTWFLIFTSSCAFLLQQLLLSVHKYKKKDFITKVDTTRNATLQFPTLTFCDMDKERNSSVKPLAQSCSEGSRNETGDASFKYGCKLFFANLNESCIFDSTQQCSYPANYTSTNNPNECYSFNRNAVLFQKSEERMYGLELLLFKNVSEIATENNTGFHPLRWTQQKRGLLLHIHPSSVYVSWSLENTVLLTPGFYTEISLQKKVYKRLEAPYASKCSSKMAFKNLIEGNYTVKNCFVSCLLLEMYQKCGDVIPPGRHFMSTDKYPPNVPQHLRSPKQLGECYNNVYLNSSAMDCGCPNPCYEERYITKVTNMPFREALFSQGMRKAIAKALNIPLSQANLETFKQSIIRLSVFYDSFVIETDIEQPLYELESLLGDFGGLMGLLIGASLISLLEVLWLIVTSLFERFTKKAQVDMQIS